MCVLDINTEALKRIQDPRIKVIAGDGCFLPFKDNSFDIVILVDCLEHIPDSKKILFCPELRRVARKCVIIHCPADNSDGRFQGTVYDRKFIKWYRKFYKKDEPNTSEHLKSGLPKIEKLAQSFPGAVIQGKQNGMVWIEYMKLGFTPYIRFITGIIYKAFLSRKDKAPPYHACLLIWRKE